MGLAIRTKNLHTKNRWFVNLREVSSSAGIEISSHPQPGFPRKCEWAHPLVNTFSNDVFPQAPSPIILLALLYHYMMSVPKNKNRNWGSKYIPSSTIFRWVVCIYAKKKKIPVSKKRKDSRTCIHYRKKLGGWENRKLNRTRNLV